MASAVIGLALVRDCRRSCPHLLANLRLGRGDAPRTTVGMARAGIRWTVTFRLRRWERRGRARAQAGNLDAEGTVRLAAIRQELTARGEQLEPVRPGSSSGWW